MLKFYTDKAAKEEISKLQTLNAELSEELSDAQSEIETLKGEIAAAQETAKDSDVHASAARAEHEEALKSKDAEIATLTAERDAALAAQKTAEEAQVEFDEKVEQAALARFEALGGEPAPASNKDKDERPLEMTREQFNAMPPRQRSEFCKAGGKISA